MNIDVAPINLHIKNIFMPHKHLNPYYHTTFTCDDCQGEFINDTAYSLALDSEQLDHYHTYCAGCVDWINEKTDKRTLRKTGRTKQFNTSVSKEWLAQLKTIAYKENLKYVEVLENALDCYDKCGRDN